MRVEAEAPQVGCCDNCGSGVTEQQIAIDNGDEILCSDCARFTN